MEKGDDGEKGGNEEIRSRMELINFQSFNILIAGDGGGSIVALVEEMRLHVFFYKLYF